MVMRKIIIVVVIIIATLQIYTQDRIDPASYINGLTSPNTMLNFNPGKFVKAWNWGSETRKLDSALLMDFSHINPTNPSSDNETKRFASLGLRHLHTQESQSF